VGNSGLGFGNATQPDASLGANDERRPRIVERVGRVWFSLCRAFQSAMCCLRHLAHSVERCETLGQPATRPGPGDIPAVERPTTLAALLVNAQARRRAWLLLREDFYREDVLQQYFGGAEVEFIDRQPGRMIRGTITSFDNMVEPITVQERRLKAYRARRREVAADVR